MHNPIFNLPSFLIGMFFGLINYSIQKGINLNTSDSYQKIFTFEKRDQTAILKNLRIIKFSERSPKEVRIISEWSPNDLRMISEKIYSNPTI